MKSIKITRGISWPLIKQNIKSQWLLILVILVIMCGMSSVINFAMSIMQTETIKEEVQNAQEDFYKHLFVMAAYDNTKAANITGKIDYYSFVEDDKNNDTDKYKKVFDAANTASESSANEGEEKLDLSVDKFRSDIEALKNSPVSIDKYISNFEYVYAISTQDGVFSGNKLEMENMITDMMQMQGVSSNLLDSIGQMDMSSLLNTMYFHVIGLLPIFLLVVIMANALIAAQVDRGSMGYILSTPTTRGSVALTQMVFLIVVPMILISIVCASRIATTNMFFGDVCVERVVTQYAGFYLLVEAVTGLCFLGSCLFNKSSHSLAFGGGLAVWFFLAAFLGVFGAANLVNIGMGVEQLGIFNNLTLTSLFDIDSISTIGTAFVDFSFVWKLAVLAGVALVSYIVGAITFTKKDLPL